jgi:hypothetical protein
LEVEGKRGETSIYTTRVNGISKVLATEIYPA